MIGFKAKLLSLSLSLNALIKGKTIVLLFNLYYTQPTLKCKSVSYNTDNGTLHVSTSQKRITVRHAGQGASEALFEAPPN
jgi:hypothetical protein